MKWFYKVIPLILMTIIINTLVLANSPVEHTEGNFTSVYSQDDKYIFGTAMGVTKGDMYISQNNIKYIIVKVKDNKATAKKLGGINLIEDILTTAQVPNITAKPKKTIGIYHTHNGESYEPGPVSLYENGEIYDVGNVLSSALEKYGIEVIHSNNLHLPQDGAAYERSRATATDIVKKMPDAIFDVHRDAIPRKKEYLTEVNGKQISQIRLVVGRQNPNQKVNDQFARQLKSISDKQYPGLIRDIFYARGSYNQQLSPNSLLFEFGTHVTSKEKAETSAVMLSDIINQLLYEGNETTKSQNKSVKNKSAFSSIVWMIVILIIGISLFLFINEGSIDGVKDRIKKFFSQELIDKGDKK